MVRPDFCESPKTGGGLNIKSKCNISSIICPKGWVKSPFFSKNSIKSVDKKWSGKNKMTKCISIVFEYNFFLKE